jgi:hypothetical protein
LQRTFLTKSAQGAAAGRHLTSADCFLRRRGGADESLAELPRDQRLPLRCSLEELFRRDGEAALVRADFAPREDSSLVALQDLTSGLLIGGVERAGAI